MAPQSMTNNQHCASRRSTRQQPSRASQRKWTCISAPAQSMSIGERPANFCTFNGRDSPGVDRFCLCESYFSATPPFMQERVRKAWLSAFDDRDNGLLERERKVGRCDGKIDRASRISSQNHQCCPRRRLCSPQALARVQVSAVGADVHVLASSGTASHVASRLEAPRVGFL
ncbi:hypothetical protein CC86DRAFT_138863 [Ophiobolus disseminans]|uniref:Uncharacterized protein n=1 Tax=Ophiobolus disseminans TaxID=1469910 RepID=A0A6A7AEV0_9PLEO|nr:hypothetical protein CC86DRAFT_138863 [Ophiobolus disseminans]